MKKIEMIESSETGAMFLDRDSALQDRVQFVHNLGVLLSQTREGISGCELDPETDVVTVHFKHPESYSMLVNVRMDSYMAIVRDVAKALR